LANQPVEKLASKLLVKSQSAAHNNALDINT
jgi:hypothetical protein